MNYLELCIVDIVRRHGKILATTVFDQLNAKLSIVAIYERTIDKLSQDGQIRRSGLFLVWWSVANDD